MSVIWAPIDVYENDTPTESLARWEQAGDEAFREQAFVACPHVWERVDYHVWQCEACGDMADLAEGWE